MRSPSRRFVLGLLLSVGTAAYATTISVGAGAFSDPPAIAFNSIVNGQAITNQFAAQGVTFNNLWGDQVDLVFFADSGVAVAANMSSHAACCVIPATMNFSTPYELIGFELFSNGYTTVNVVGVDGQTNIFDIYAYVPPIRNSRDQIVVQAKGVFVGFENPTGISSISIGPSALNNAFLVDNIVLQAPVVPEPGTFALVAICLLGLAAGARRLVTPDPNRVVPARR